MPYRVGVVGAGTMGHGIAELCAISGHKVVLADVSSEILERATDSIRWSLERISKSGIPGEAPESVMARITTTTDLARMSDSYCVIEAVKERKDVKRQVLEKLDRICDSKCMLFTNTSTIPVTDLAAMTSRADRFAGVHFSNPPVKMPLVEIIRGEGTSQETLERAREFVSSLNKEYIVLEKDVPGFLINRLNDRLFTEALAMLEEGVQVNDIDAMARFRLGFPMGIFELLDFVGIDVVYNASGEMIRHGFATEQSARIKNMVEENRLGMKTGVGFYEYPGKKVYSRPFIKPSEAMYRIDPCRLLAPVINEAAWIIRNGVAGTAEVEKGMTMAMNWPHGPLELADMTGLQAVIDVLNTRRQATGLARYAPDDLILNLKNEGHDGVLAGKGFLDWNTELKALGPVTYTGAANFALVVMNRPEKLNSLSEEVWEALATAFRKAASDDQVRSVIITGSGRAFSAGDDIAMMEKWKEPADAGEWMEKYAAPLINLLAEYPKPVISAVDGLAFGGGCELNMLFDVVIASDRAVFSLPEGLIGAMPPIASSYGIKSYGRRIVPYLFTGDWISAEKAKELGLADFTVPEGKALALAIEIAGRIARLSPLATNSIKASVVKARGSSREISKAAQDELVRLASTEDFAEGQRSFLEKRRPVWTGR